MRKDWQIEDILDLEYFFHRDDPDRPDAPSADGLARRDRAIYLDSIAPETPDDPPPSRRRIIRSWLDHRRAAEKKALPPEAPLPGEAYAEIYRLLTWLFLLFGVLSGAGLASSFLTYTGTAPLNVAYYFGGLILSQFLLMAILLAALVVRTANRSLTGNSILYSLVSRLLVRFAGWAKQKAVHRMAGSQRTGIDAAMGLLKGRRKVYGSLFYWPIFILLQIFGVFFNIGVIAATLVKVLFSDIAFGWQSTVQFGPEAIHDLVRIIALPWSFFVPGGIAYPSLAQIEGSRMVLKEGIYFLATEDLIAWWPFLLFAVIFYGLLPRALLLISGLLARNRAIKCVDFKFSECDRLIHRLESPRVSTEGIPTAGPDLPSDAGTVRTVKSPADAQKAASGDRRIIALVPDDIFEDCTGEALQSAVQSTLGDQVMETLRIGEGYAADQGVLEALSRKDWENGRPHVLVVQEGWQPPIREVLGFIRDLRETVGERTGIAVGLVGKPRPDTIFTPVNDTDWTVWRQKTSGLGDPYLRLEKLVDSG